MNMLLHFLDRIATLSHTIGLRVFARLTLTLLIVATGTVQSHSQETLEQYGQQYQKATAAAQQLAAALKQKLQANPDGSIDETIAEDRERLRQLREAQAGYLAKLISLDPANKGHRFELAKLAVVSGNRELATNILKELAPLDVLGYQPAHFVLAQFYASEPTSGAEERQSNLGFALKHLDHALTGNKNNLPAKLLKSKILVALERFEDCYQLHEELLETTPFYFRDMLQLNNRLQRKERNPQVCEKALAGFERLLEAKETMADDRRWIIGQQGIAQALWNLDRHEEAAARLKELIKANSGSRGVFLERLRSATFIDWAGKVANLAQPIDSLPPATQEKLLDLFAQAYRNHPNNIRTLESLTRLSLSQNEEIAEKAKAVYDAAADPSASSEALNQLGSHALINENFSDAVRLLERAREKSSRNPMILNNLAYAYLVIEQDKRNGERALKLVEEAIRMLPNKLPSVQKSSFLHTKAAALKELGRLEEAITFYEKSLESRPNDTDTLEPLIECYRDSNRQPPQDYLQRLEKLSP